MNSNGYSVGDSKHNVNQAINKQRKNIDPLLKFLLSYKYYEPNAALTAYPVPDEFDDFSQYQSSFQVRISLIKRFLSKLDADFE